MHVKKKEMSKLKPSKGFTLVELIVVVAIILIIAVLVVAAIGGIMDTARESALESDANAIARQFNLYNAVATDENTRIVFWGPGGGTMINDPPSGFGVNTIDGVTTISLVHDTTTGVIPFQTAITLSQQNFQLLTGDAPGGHVTLEYTGTIAGEDTDGNTTSAVIGMWVVVPTT